MLPAKNQVMFQSSAQNVNKEVNAITSNAPPPYKELHRTEKKYNNSFVQKSAPSQGTEQPVKQKPATVASKTPPPYSFFQRSQPSSAAFSRESFGSLRSAQSENQSQKVATLSGEALSKALK